MKKNYIIIFLLSLFFQSMVTNNAEGQGCVAIRSFSGCGTIGMGSGANLLQGEWLTSLNFRYFQSFRHFRGSHEEVNRVEEGTEVINDSYFFDLSLNYAFTDRLYSSVSLPFVYHERSSMYEHGGNPPNGLGERHKTYAQGLADMRLSLGYWLLNPDRHHNNNISLSLGVKLPTGSYNSLGTFYNQGENRNEIREAAVDQSIQPGDGGFGISFEAQGYRFISHKFLLSGSFYYLANPKSSVLVDSRSGGKREYSSPDQYAIRLGTTYLLPQHGLGIYLGARREAVPSSDLIGENNGFRRPGFVVSIDPGLVYNKGNWTTSFNLPVALVRNRTRSFEDKINGRHGDAAFADYTINLSIGYRIKKTPKLIPLELPQAQ